MAIGRLYIMCEGQTEEAFVNLILVEPFRLLCDVETTPLLLPNKPGAASRRHKGGWRSYAVARRYFRQVMQTHHRNGAWFTTMLDVYAVPTDFPGLDLAPRSPAVARVEALEAAFADDVKTDRLWRFTPHLQLHEYEALLLVDIDAIGRTLPEYAATGVPALKGDIRALRPEEVDGGQSSAPSKRIIRHFPDYDGAKASAGPIIAADIGLDRLRVACPHFGRWLTTLEAEVQRT